MCSSAKARFRMAVVCCWIENSPSSTEFWTPKLYLHWNSCFCLRPCGRLDLNIHCFHLDYLAPSCVICWIYYRARALIFGIWKWCYVTVFLVCGSLKIYERHETFSVNADTYRTPLQLAQTKHFVLSHSLELGQRLGSVLTDHLFIFWILFVCFKSFICYMFSISILLSNKDRI